MLAYWSALQSMLLSLSVLAYWLQSLLPSQSEWQLALQSGWVSVSVSARYY
jgi:hypothetical protein